MISRRNVLKGALAGVASFFGFGNHLLQASNAVEDDKIRFTGSFLRADVPNGNNRIYTREVLEKIVKDFKKNDIEHCGQLGMPCDGRIHADILSHKVNNIKLQDDELIADIEVINTPSGRKLAEMIKNHEVALRTQGMVSNSTYKENGVCVIGNDYELIAINAVPIKDAIQL